MTGNAGFTSGFNDHQSVAFGRVFTSTRGSTAPRFTHSSNSAISAAGSFSFGGI